LCFRAKTPDADIASGLPCRIVAHIDDNHYDLLHPIRATYLKDTEEKARKDRLKAEAAQAGPKKREDDKKRRVLDDHESVTSTKKSRQVEGQAGVRGFCCKDTAPQPSTSRKEAEVCVCRYQLYQLSPFPYFISRAFSLCLLASLSGGLSARYDRS
jgi:hypothetical protein